MASSNDKNKHSSASSSQKLPLEHDTSPTRPAEPCRSAECAVCGTDCEQNRRYFGVQIICEACKVSSSGLTLFHTRTTK